MTTVLTEKMRDAWDDIAAGYDQFVAPTEVWLANEALTRAGLQPGERVLDVAAGPGGLSLPASDASRVIDRRSSHLRSRMQPSPTREHCC